MVNALIRPLAGLIALVVLPMAGTLCAAEATSVKTLPSDRMLADYFATETAKITATSLANTRSLSEWQSRRPEFRRQAAEMLGLDLMPARTDLHPLVTGKLEQEDFTVEKICFQSRPHLYVTANLYLPKHLSGKAPTILYLCGHSAVVTNGVSYGNKTAYQQHGIWFARNGYVCLIIDTLQWGEILGHHQGTYHDEMWWWNSRGYTPAGVETWNAIRALDYLGSRPEVDSGRIGVTGRSGGGAYSWFLAAIDDRVKVIAPVAGITDLQNYVVDGAVDGHCDCMFLVNTYRWDYPLLAALCAPRPLLLANSDADSLFPLSGVMRTRDEVKRVYDLYQASTNFGLVIGPGLHKDTQEMQVPVFHWFNEHLKHTNALIEMAAVKMFPPAELKVLDKIPADQINTSIESSFVPEAPTPKVPITAEAWKQMQTVWMQGLREKCFAGWPTNNSPPPVHRLFSTNIDGIRYETYEIESQENVALQLCLMSKAGNAQPRKISLRVADVVFTNTSPDSLAEVPGEAEKIASYFGSRETVDRLIAEIKGQNVVEAVFFPRGIGPGAWSGDIKGQTQLRRRFMLLGQTLDGMRVWDIRRAIQALHSMEKFRETPLTVAAENGMAINVLYASLFEPNLGGLSLAKVPSSHDQGPDYLNVLKVLDVPEAAAMTAERCPLRLEPNKESGWEFLRAISVSSMANVKVEWVK